MNSQKLRHVILTRFNLGLYDKPGANEWMEHRFPLFDKTRQSILEQDGEFEWWLSMDGRTPEKWINRIFTDSRMRITSDHPKDFRCDGWTITTRMDNDDLYLPGAVKAIQESASKQEMVLDLRYFGMSGGKLYHSERVQPNSPFLSLVENGVKRTCYARPHSNMLEEYKSIFVSRDEYALMVIHDRNLGNRVVGREVNFRDLPKHKRDYIKRFL